MMAVVKVFIRVSTALCRRQTLVSAVPISFDAPEMSERRSINKLITCGGCGKFVTERKEKQLERENSARRQLPFALYININKLKTFPP